MTLYKLMLASLSFAAVALGEQFPQFHMKSLSDHEVVLPNAVIGHIAVIIAGFTRASSAAADAWRKAAEKEFASDARYSVIEAAILEDVPRLFRSMVVGSIRKGVPAARQDQFLTTFQSEKAWKQLVGFSEPDDAYVILLDGKGEIRLHEHGRFTESQFDKFRNQAKRLPEQSGPIREQ